MQQLEHLPLCAGGRGDHQTGLRTTESVVFPALKFMV